MIGVLGGTFDPVHFGHLRPALELLKGLPLDEIRFIPCRAPPHRPPPVATAEQRWYMLSTVLHGISGLRADDRELRRPGPSYTVDTLEGLRGELGGPEPLCLIMGSDAYCGFPTWHRWRDILDLAHLIVVKRPGSDLAARGEAAELVEHSGLEGPQQLTRGPSGGVLVCEVGLLDISATEIRACIAAGEQPRYLLPGAVWAYIRRSGLYGAHA
jgi:nicotinate-nucleotide adenylyltransferase